MNVNDQDRQTDLEGRKHVMLSEAKHLTGQVPRCFASLSMTLPILVVKVHNRVLSAVEQGHPDAIHRVPTMAAFIRQCTLNAGKTIMNCSDQNR